MGLARRCGRQRPDAAVWGDSDGFRGTARGRGGRVPSRTDLRHQTTGVWDRAILSLRGDHRTQGLMACVPRRPRHEVLTRDGRCGGRTTTSH